MGGHVNRPEEDVVNINGHRISANLRVDSGRKDQIDPRSTRTHKRSCTTYSFIMSVSRRLEGDAAAMSLLGYARLMVAEGGAPRGV